jgi:hypothetical protein
MGDVYDYNQLGIPAPPYVDLIAASVSRLNASHIQLKMTAAGSIPSSLERSHNLAYLWQFDTDRNPGTRMFSVNDIGVDVAIRAFHDVQKGWIGDIDTIEQAPTGMPQSQVVVSANTAVVTVSCGDLGNPPSFNWVVSALEGWTDGKDKPNFHDHVPSKGYVSYDLTALSCATVRTVTSTQISVYTATQMSTRTETVPVLFGSLSLTYALLLIALASVGVVAYVVGRRTRKPVSEPSRTGLFEVSVTVPSVGKTVSIEAGPDHTIGSLVESLASTLNLPKGKAYAVEYEGGLISQSDFGRTLGALGIKEGSKLTLLQQ